MRIIYYMYINSHILIFKSFTFLHTPYLLLLIKPRHSEREINFRGISDDRILRKYNFKGFNVLD